LAQQGADRFPLARGLRTAWLWYRWHVAAGVLIVAWLAMVNRVMAQPESGESSSRSTVLMLLCLTLFVMAFPVAIAGVRGGWASISEAYTRAPVEYIGDIGKGGTIRGLFREYLAMHGDLSLHSKVHPPGPVAILWLLSYVVGRGPLALSLATAAVAALAVVPLYLWGRDLAGRRVGITCVSLYALMPSIVLFTATSADILFMPFSITTLWLFDRALRRGSWAYAVSAGVCYGLLGLLSFNLLTLGAYFAFAGLLHVRTPGGLARVVRTAATMVAAFCTVHGVVYAWSGFDIVACFHASKAQFDLDQIHVTVVEGRWPAWTWKIVNPACWFYFAGIPISLLFIRRLAKPQGDTKPLFIVFALTFLAINLLYLARGEGERSAMYVLPFVVLPAAHRLDELVRRQGSARPLVATLASLGFLCWLTELHFDTYW
ncbi:MAG: glycosyltransferase family 39 protein, partial [bacterium]|nr:glycosyltransferase family 39 protein [bacterium]